MAPELLWIGTRPQDSGVSMQASTRYYELDLLRFLAALSVVFYHYGFRGYAGDRLSDLAFPTLAPLVKYGYLGVDLFFMISGFVILMSAQQLNVGQFLRSRACRLYPAFWVCVTLTAALMGLIGDDRYPISWRQYLWNLTMVSGFWEVPFVDGVYWTLLVEIKFYGLIALLLTFRQLQHIQYYLMGWLTLVFLSPKLAFPEWLNALVFPEWAPYFIAGAVFYLIRQRGIQWPLAATLFGAYLLALRNAWWRTPNQALYFQTEFSVPLVMGLITLCFVVMGLLALNRLGWLNHRAMLSVGMLTYPLYLLHENIGFMLFNQFHTQFNSYFILGGVTLILLLVSWWISHTLEPWGASKLKSALQGLSPKPKFKRPLRNSWKAP